MPSTKSKRQREYADNSGIRKNLRNKSRKRYRKEQGASFEIGGASVLRSLEFYREAAVVAPTLSPDETSTHNYPILSMTETAKLLDVTYQTLWRWTTDDVGILPPPIFKEMKTGRLLGVYHADEVKVMIEVIGKHLNGYKYYRKDHTTTRDTLFDKITEVRVKLEKDAHNGN